MIETIIILILIIYIIIYNFRYKNLLKTVIAYNNISYVVNDLPDAQQAANMLAKIMYNLNKLIDKIIDDKNKTEEDNNFIEYVYKIKERLPYVKISENPSNSNYTSYSVNKGEELVFCIRDNKKYNIHPLNELLYVAIHEIAHIGCPEIGHGKLFQSINLYLLKKAINYNIYTYINYNKYNKNYCGMTLTSTIIE